MNAVLPVAPTNAESDLLIQTRSYLTRREHGLSPSQDLEAAWRRFYEVYDRKIHAYAYACGALHHEIADCVQEVWRELLVRLPTFQLDPCRGQFDTWLFHIVQGKTADLRRSRRRNAAHTDSEDLQRLTDCRASGFRAMEDEELVALAWDELRRKVSACTFQVLQLRLVEQRPVVEVAEKLGLSHEQVWYRYHRARRELEEIGLALAAGRCSPAPVQAALHQKKVKGQEPAQARATSSVSRSVGPCPRARHGGHRVDYVFQRLELGRRELTPEWKVEWNCDHLPKPVLYIRKVAIVAYAEICGSGDFITTHWPRIVNAAIAAGVAAGIATIIATPTAALPVFRTEFHKQLQGKGGGAVEELIQVALSAMQEPSGPWCVCKD